MQNNQNTKGDGDFNLPLFTWDDDDDWNAMVSMRNQVPTVAPRAEATAGGMWVDHTVADPVASVSDGQTVASPAPINCHNIASIPPGRQPTANLQCGMCTNPRLYHRKADLKRHMETHLPATHFCHVNGCNRGPGKGFTRVDKLNEHLNKIHGLQRRSSSSN